MRTITLPRHLWASFGHPSLTRPREAKPESCVDTHDTKPRAPAATADSLWATGRTRLFGIVLPNLLQTVFFGVLCLGLALPVFLLDSSGHGLYHGLITLGSLAAFAGFCWIVGMLLAHTASSDFGDKPAVPRAPVARGREDLPRD